MPAPVSSLSRPPYGLAFSIDELLMVRDWAEARTLHMIVALDQVLENAEFEEMIILAPPGRRKRILTVWRTLGSVFLQTPGGRPRAFATMPEALASLHPVRSPRPSILRFLGFGS